MAENPPDTCVSGGFLRRLTCFSAPVRGLLPDWLQFPWEHLAASMASTIIRQNSASSGRAMSME